VEVGILRKFKGDRRRLAVRAARMGADQAARHVIAQHETRVAHAERLENVPLEIGLQGLAAHRLDDLAGKIDADAVLPVRARIEQQRYPQCVILAGDDAGQSGDLDVTAQVAVEDVVTVARRMREQVAERNRRLGIA
jgi:hypothetical protein